jgi:hypothetical protein
MPSTHPAGSGPAPGPPRCTDRKASYGRWRPR